MINRENTLAALWASAYCMALVLVVGLCDRIGVQPYYFVPFVIVILPFLIALALSPLQSAGRKGKP